jgi:hypothetical protein
MITCVVQFIEFVILVQSNVILVQSNVLKIELIWTVQPIKVLNNLIVVLSQFKYLKR